MIGNVLRQFLSNGPPALADHVWQSTLFAAVAALLTLPFADIPLDTATACGWLPH